MRWIGRFFLVIALIFLALDITDPIAGTGETGPATPQAGGAATGGAGAGATTTGDSTTGGATAAGTADSGTATGGTTGGTTTGGDDTAAAGETASGAGAATSEAVGPNRVMLHSLGERWHQYHPSSALQVSPAVSRHVSPWLDDNIVQPLMLQPAFLIFFALWLIFSFFSWLIGRGRRYDDDEDW